MNRLWTTFLILAIVTIIAVTAYQFYISLSGGNVNQVPAIIAIDPDLGLSKLQAFAPLTNYQPVDDESLNGK